MESVKDWAQRIKASVERVILGKSDVIEKLLVAMLCRGHVLLEDVPGVGKTILARAIARSLGGEFKRVQCTADLLPADVLGVSIYNQREGRFVFRQGPIVTNVLLVDEINRATPRTQSALLEAMEERRISVEGRSLALPDPFLILATENPVEFEGTFPLPEAQKDRFFLCLSMGYPPEEAELEMLTAQRRLTHPVSDLDAVTGVEEVLAMQRQILDVPVPREMEDYILSLVAATRADPRLQLGASPRASIALYKGAQALAAMRGRTVAVLEDVREIAPPILLKRVQVRSEHLIRGVTEAAVIGELLRQADAMLVEQAT
jgi:MoxR-like ATPase